MSGILYIVGTPIGNLEDITFRAVRILGEVDTILAEDTRNTAKLLSKYEIKKELKRYDSHLTDGSINWVLRSLSEGKNLALVTDAGTPAISDPGSFLVRKVFEHFGNNAKVIPIPGASALTTALSGAGITDSSFTFLGFPPQKKGRQTFFDYALAHEDTVVMYESPHRILKTLEAIATLQPARIGSIARELTKIHEEIVHGTLHELWEYYLEHKDKVRGEFVVIIGPSRYSKL